MISRIVEFIEDQKTASICCVDEHAHPYCFSCYYVFHEAERLLIFKSSKDTHHAQLLNQKTTIAGTILPDKQEPLSIKGIQFTGILLEADDALYADISKAYYKKIPFARAMPGDLYTIRLDKIKMTDNTLGIGKKNTLGQSNRSQTPFLSTKLFVIQHKYKTKNMAFKTIIEPFKIKSVEPIHMSTEEERIAYMKEAHYNPFLLYSKQVIIDLLTDSGTSAMSSEQWAGIMRGDESYAGASSWEKLEYEINDLTGYTYTLPTHQGRAAERILYGYLGGKGRIFISNTHFDTTRANIEFSGAEAIDIPTSEAEDHNSEFHFKGDMDIHKLEVAIKTYGASNISAVILTVTNNSGGGQPVSMENTILVSNICKKHKILFIIDCCRIAENSYFIHHYEKGYGQYTYREIAQQMFALADGCVMSAKKDALVNMGGFLALRDEALANACTNLLIITEGFATYGGLSGRDMEAIAIGLREVFDKDYLHYRITSTKYLGEHIRAKGVPILYPVGGHAVYIDAGALYPHIPTHEYPGQALVCELYKKGGIRAVEIGSVMFGKYDEAGKLIPAPIELVRLAIPRRVYTQSHIDYVVEVFDEIIKTKHETKGLKITKEPKFLRHFTAHFAEL